MFSRTKVERSEGIMLNATRNIKDDGEILTD